MNTIKTLLAMLFVFLLSSVAFAQANTVETGIAADVVTSAQIVADLTGNDDPVNFRRGRGRGHDGTGDEDDAPGAPDGHRGSDHPEDD